MSNNFAFRTAGRITCRKCNAKSKRKVSSAVRLPQRGRPSAAFMAEQPTGPKTERGRQRCAEAETTHEFETRKARIERAEGMCRLRTLEELGYALEIMFGPRTPGRRPNSLSNTI